MDRFLMLIPIFLFMFLMLGNQHSDPEQKKETE